MKQVKELGRLPVVNFAAGGVATPADAALMMQLGADGVFVGSGIFKAAEDESDSARRREKVARRAAAIVKAVTNYNDPEVLAEVSRDLGSTDARPRAGRDPRGRTARHKGLVTHVHRQQQRRS